MVARFSSHCRVCWPITGVHSFIPCTRSVLREIWMGPRMGSHSLLPACLLSTFISCRNTYHEVLSLLSYVKTKANVTQSELKRLTEKQERMFHTLSSVLRQPLQRDCAITSIAAHLPLARGRVMRARLCQAAHLPPSGYTRENTDVSREKSWCVPDGKVSAISCHLPLSPTHLGFSSQYVCIFKISFCFGVWFFGGCCFCCFKLGRVGLLTFRARRTTLTGRRIVPEAETKAFGTEMQNRLRRVGWGSSTILTIGSTDARNILCKVEWHLAPGSLQYLGDPTLWPTKLKL